MKINSHRIISFFKVYQDRTYNKIKGPNDLIIVEYPKSGVTFLSVLIANLIKVNDIEFNYYNIETFVSSRHHNNAVPTSHKNMLNLRLFKSHCEYTDSYNNIIHLFRDPTDSLLSYFNYFNDFIGNKSGTSFTQFIRSRRGIDRWLSHTSSWLKDYDSSKRYMPVSYELLVRDPKVFIDKFLFLNGYSEKISEYQITEALNVSSKQSMLNFENEYRNGGRSLDENSLFTGAKKFTKDQIREEDIKYIEEKTIGLTTELNRIIEAFYYE